MLSELRTTGHGTTGFVFPHSAAHLHAMPVSSGFSLETTPDYDWDGLKRGRSPLVLFQYTLSGKGMLRYEDREMEVGPGMAMLIHFPHNHRYWLPRGWAPWEFVWVVAGGAELQRLWQVFEQRAGPCIRLRQTGEAVECAMRIYVDGVRKAIQTPFEASSRIYRLAMALADEILVRDATATRAPEMQRVIDYCAKNSASAITVDDMALVSGFSRYHFCRRFRASEETTPIEHLTSLRVGEAARLLTDRSLSVKEVAFRSGFSDPNYFCKVFRKKMGVAPGEFRKVGG